jgi:hypothetical protein
MSHWNGIFCRRVCGRMPAAWSYSRRSSGYVNQSILLILLHDLKAFATACCKCTCDLPSVLVSTALHIIFSSTCCDTQFIMQACVLAVVRGSSLTGSCRLGASLILVRVTQHQGGSIMGAQSLCNLKGHIFMHSEDQSKRHFHNHAHAQAAQRLRSTEDIFIPEVRCQHAYRLMRTSFQLVQNCTVCQTTFLQCVSLLCS